MALFPSRPFEYTYIEPTNIVWIILSIANTLKIFVKSAYLLFSIYTLIKINCFHEIFAGTIHSQLGCFFSFFFFEKNSCNENNFKLISRHIFFFQSIVMILFLFGLVFGEKKDLLNFRNHKANIYFS